MVWAVRPHDASKKQSPFRPRENLKRENLKKWRGARVASNCKLSALIRNNGFCCGYYSLAMLNISFNVILDRQIKHAQLLHANSDVSVGNNFSGDSYALNLVLKFGASHNLLNKLKT